jgi:hypothetical protein
MKPNVNIDRINEIKIRYMDLFVEKGKKYIEALGAHVGAKIELDPTVIPTLKTMINGLIRMTDEQLIYYKGDLKLIKKLREESSRLHQLRLYLDHYEARISDIQDLFEMICRNYKEELILREREFRKAA